MGMVNRLELKESLNLSGKHVPEVWLQGLEQIWRYGSLTEVIYDGKPIETAELIGLRTQIYLPDKGAFPDGYIWKAGSQSWEDYRAGFLSKENPGFEYTYGSRLRAWGAGQVYKKEGQSLSIDQIEYIIRELRRDRSSRRAVAITWVPPIDENTESPPCMMSFQALIRGDRLNAIVPYRSHDFFGAYPANAYGLTGVMQYIAEEVGNCGMGNLIFFSESAHIYWFNWPEVAKLLGEKIPMPFCKQKQEQVKAIREWRKWQRQTIKPKT